MIREDYPGRVELIKAIQKGAKQMVYTVDDKMRLRLDNDYTYHSPKDDQASRYVEIREAAKTLAWIIVTRSPASREQSVALTHLDEVVMNANAAIARNE